MIKKISWEEFRSTGMLWYVNRMLQIFGVSIVCDVEENSTIKEVYPAYTKFIGFSPEADEEGFNKLRSFLKLEE